MEPVWVCDPAILIRAVDAVFGKMACGARLGLRLPCSLQWHFERETNSPEFSPDQQKLHAIRASICTQGFAAHLHIV